MSEWIDGVEFSICIKNPKIICVNTHDCDQKCPCDEMEDSNE